MSDLLQKISRAWNQFWFLKGPPHALAVFRICLGIFAFIYWIYYLPRVSMLFMDGGFCLPMYRFEGGFSDISGLQDLIGFITRSPGWFQAWSCYGVLVLSTIFITIGFAFRTSCCVYLFLSFYHFFVYVYAILSSYDRTLILMVFLLLLSPCAKIFSVDSHLESKSPKELTPKVYPLWSQRLICVQIAFLYFGTGATKMKLEAWKSGDMLKAVLADQYANSLGFWVHNNMPSDGVFDVMVLSVILFEVVAGYTLFLKRWQKPTMAFGLLFHSSNWILMNIWRFMFIPFTYVLFLHPVEVANWLDEKTGRKVEGDYAEPGSEYWDPLQ